MCTSPIPAWRVGDQITFNVNPGLPAPLQLPCGQCAECRLKRSREWAIRCVHEASLHKDNCFLTLTYDDDHLKSPSLDYSHFQSFMKRLRARFPKDRIGFFCAGEYGETNPATGVVDGGKYRPHYHAVLFNFNFPDRQPARLLGRADLFTSKVLNELWRMGDCRIGEVTFESAAYVARYAMKKITGHHSKEAYTIITEYGEMIERKPEFCVMSKRPAIGRRWFEKYGAAAYDRDAVVARGHEMQPPRYYDKLLPEVVRGMIQRQREEDGKTRRKDHTPERNKVRDVVVRAKLDQFKRS